ncbi:MAG: hypothetical protein AABZ02_15070 [Bacteroidota bacterium]
MELKTDLNRIFSSAFLACMLLLLFVFLEPPISILAWFIFGAALLSLVYIAVASFLIIKKLPSDDQHVH